MSQLPARTTRANTVGARVERPPPLVPSRLLQICEELQPSALQKSSEDRHRRGRACCSRFCICQSTQEPQGSTGLAEEAVSYSIETTYFHSISTDFHKERDLFWDRWSDLHNYRRLNGIQRASFGVRVRSSAVREYSFGILRAVQAEATQILFRTLANTNRLDQTRPRLKLNSLQTLPFIARALQLPVAESSGDGVSISLGPEGGTDDAIH
jgi:hypothetical protein